MQYRILPHGGEKIGVIGLGLGSVTPGTDVYSLLDYSLEKGINFYDLCGAYDFIYPEIKRTLSRHRSEVFTQMHLGAVYKNGAYAFSRNLRTVKDTFNRLLDTTGLEYTDFGFLHCIDEEKDLEYVLNKGIYELALKLKAQGIIKHLGFSTHSPLIAEKLINLGGFDLFMFSINAAFDFKKGDYAVGDSEERENLYRLAQSKGVAISAMKPFAGGQLLNAKLSPLGIALTPVQCLAYVLERPAVVTVVAGATKISDIDDYMNYFTASKDELDYSALGTVLPEDAKGRCLYCNHCAPCPKKINVGLVNKYYDLSKLGDPLAKQHYLNLDHHASECNDCGHCDRRCPFKTQQIKRMHEIAGYFGI